MSGSNDKPCSAYVGLVDKNVEPWKLESRFFPSKAGGYPAWLDLKNLPGAEDLKCGKCSSPCIFLCQVYAPIEERKTCFHRTIFVFMCIDPECYEKNNNKTFIVLRCQLPRKNDFYSYEPPVFEESWAKEVCASKYCKLCDVCGCNSSSHCGKCKKINYCGRRHQIVDWKAGHSGLCGKGAEIVAESKLLLPTFELCTELDDDTDSDESSDSEAEDGEERIAALGGESEMCEAFLRMARCEKPADKAFARFQKYMSKFPSQVLRYERNGEPIWLTDENLPTVPPCSLCGAARVYEFQVLPQILNFLGLDRLEKSVDWGTLVIYTCSESCDQGPPYKAEFLWKQDLSE